MVHLLCEFDTALYVLNQFQVDSFFFSLYFIARRKQNIKTLEKFHKLGRFVIRFQCSFSYQKKREKKKEYAKLRESEKKRRNDVKRENGKRNWEALWAEYKKCQAIYMNWQIDPLNWHSNVWYCFWRPNKQIPNSNNQQNIKIYIRNTRECSIYTHAKEFNIRKRKLQYW